MKKLTNLLEQVFLRASEPSAITQLLNDYPLGSYEIASTVWNWFCKRQQEVSFNYLYKLGVSSLEKSLALISEEVLSLPLNQILSTETLAAYEAPVGSFLDEHQHLLRTATRCYSPGDVGHCLKEFYFGNDLKADFVIVSPRRSIPPIITFVELEPPAASLFTQKGMPAERLREARMQVEQWQYWIKQHPDGFITGLENRLGKALDPRSLRKWIYQNEASISAYIFIGRRKDIEDNDRRPIVTTAESNLIIHTYDTLLDIAYHLDKRYFEEMRKMETEQMIKQMSANSYTVKASTNEMLRILASDQMEDSE